MRAYKLEVLVIDFDDVGDEVASLIENARYPNDCISPSVMHVEARDIGEWSDEHPLNKRDKMKAAYKRIFGDPLWDAVAKQHQELKGNNMDDMRCTEDNFHEIMDAIKDAFINASPEDKEVWANTVDGMLDDLLRQDFFGTEGQSDPRGDRRN